VEEVIKVEAKDVSADCRWEGTSTRYIRHLVAFYLTKTTSKNIYTKTLHNNVLDLSAKIFKAIRHK
jgi:hypothetical protein